MSYRHRRLVSETRLFGKRCGRPYSPARIHSRERSFCCCTRCCRDPFSHRESFVVIALTGRTGSGCSTVARLLTTVSFDKIALPTIPNPPENNEDRKDRIVLNWLREHWHPFQCIQVSQVILLLALANRPEVFLTFLRKIAPSADFDTLNKLLNEDQNVHLDTYSTLTNLRGATDEQVRKACDHIQNKLPALSAQIKESLNTQADKAYTRVFQMLGDNTREILHKCPSCSVI